MQDNHRTLLCYKLALQQEKVLHEINLYEELLLEYRDYLNLSLLSAGARANAGEFFIPPHVNELTNCEQDCFCDGSLTAVTNVMGIENFLKRIRALFTSNHNAEGANNENSRKRRNTNVVDLVQQRLPLKYRRVDNTFPKVLPMSQQIDEQDDDDCVLTGAATNVLNSHSSYPQSAHSTTNTTTTSELTNGPVRYNMQRSMFDAPQTTRKVIQYRNSTDIKLSDDEDDLYHNYVTQKSNVIDGTKGIRKSDKPIELTCDSNSGSTNWTTIITANQANAPPQLMRKQKSTTATSLVPNSDCVMCTSSVSSHEAPSVESNLTLVNSFWPSVPHRAGVQEREVSDHGEYLRLLQKNMPRVYVPSSNEEPKDKQQHVVKCTKKSLLAECEIIQKQPFSSTTINIDGAYDKQEIHQFVIDDDDDIVDIDKVHATTTTTTTLSDLRMRSNINIRREQSASVQVTCKSTSNQRTSVEPVDLTDDDDGDGDVEEILNINGLDDDTNGDTDIHIIHVTKETAFTEPNSASLVTNATPVNTLDYRLRNCEIMKKNWSDEFEQKWSKIRESQNNESQLIESQIKELSNTREKYIRDVLSNRLERQVSLHDKPSLPKRVITIESDDDDEDTLFPLTEDQLRMLQNYLKVHDKKVLVYKFNLSITRSDILSLCGTNWLNDEVINFYMNLLTERSEQRSELPAVYAMNTFFTQRLMAGGYAAVKRWTRKVDIFSKDIIPVPVHVGGVHWCMAIIHLKQKTIKYYDSMGQPNNSVLRALEKYLHEESFDKRKRAFDTREFKIESVTNSPRQSNGSDCGVFSCMTAEYITRDRPITFNQSNMNYFRQKMILEIVGGKLWK